MKEVEITQKLNVLVQETIKLIESVLIVDGTLKMNKVTPKLGPSFLETESINGVRLRRTLFKDSWRVINGIITVRAYNSYEGAIVGAAKEIIKNSLMNQDKTYEVQIVAIPVLEDSEDTLEENINKAFFKDNTLIRNAVYEDVTIKVDIANCCYLVCPLSNKLFIRRFVGHVTSKTNIEALKVLVYAAYDDIKAQQKAFNTIIAANPDNPKIVKQLVDQFNRPNKD